jgi:hypothetical protein
MVFKEDGSVDVFYASLMSSVSNTATVLVFDEKQQLVACNQGGEARRRMLKDEKFANACMQVLQGDGGHANQGNEDYKSIKVDDRYSFVIVQNNDQWFREYVLLKYFFSTINKGFGLFELNTETGESRAKFITDCYSDIMGLEKHRLLSQGIPLIGDVTHPDDRGHSTPVSHDAISRSSACEWPIRIADGNGGFRWVRYHFTSQQAADPICVLAGGIEKFEDYANLLGLDAARMIPGVGTDYRYAPVIPDAGRSVSSPWARREAERVMRLLSTDGMMDWTGVAVAGNKLYAQILLEMADLVDRGAFANEPSVSLLERFMRRNASSSRMTILVIKYVLATDPPGVSPEYILGLISRLGGESAAVARVLRLELAIMYMYRGGDQVRGGFVRREIERQEDQLQVKLLVLWLEVVVSRLWGDRDPSPLVEQYHTLYPESKFVESLYIYSHAKIS